MIARRWQQAEGALVFVAALAAYAQFDVSMAWWLAALFFFAPDLSFLGYIAGPRAGSFAYNVSHLYSLGLLVFAIALVVGASFWIGVGLLFLGHSGFDRMLGYGLKSEESFQITHLGPIGKSKSQ